MLVGATAALYARRKFQSVDMGRLAKLQLLADHWEKNKIGGVDARSFFTMLGMVLQELDGPRSNDANHHLLEQQLDPVPDGASSEERRGHSFVLSSGNG